VLPCSVTTSAASSEISGWERKITTYQTGLMR
jgi:hypothetical protein